MTRDEARAAFAASGLTYEVLSRASLECLRKRIDAEMKRAKLMGGTLRMRRINRFRRAEVGTWAGLRCKAHYFDDREAVTFNPDGFIGLAGWAEDENVRPILAGFLSWVKAQKSATPASPIPPHPDAIPDCGGSQS